MSVWQSIKGVLSDLAAPLQLAWNAVLLGRVAAALFLLVTAPVYWVMVLRRRKVPRKGRDSAFVYTMR